MVSRLRFLGVRAAGADIALLGGFMAAFNVAISALALWVMAYPGIADEGIVVRALYYIVFAVGGVGFSVPMGFTHCGYLHSGAQDEAPSKVADHFWADAGRHRRAKLR